MEPEHEALPMDSDLEVADTGRVPRPIHLRPGAMVIVAVGGAVGTGARTGLSLVIPSLGGFPTATFAINLAGALLLGLLLESLARSGPDQGARQRLRLLLGTGFCGGFTTYSSLAASSAVLIASGRLWSAATYGLLTVLLGLLASMAGIGIGSVLGGRARR